MVAFATGSVTIQCAKTKAEVKAILNVPDINDDGEATRVTIPSISETDVKEDPRSALIQYSLKNEEIEFRRKDVVFWSISEAVDPPLIQVRQEAIIR